MLGDLSLIHANNSHKEKKGLPNSVRSSKGPSYDTGVQPRPRGRQAVPAPREPAWSAVPLASWAGHLREALLQGPHCGREPKGRLYGALQGELGVWTQVLTVAARSLGPSVIPHLPWRFSLSWLSLFLGREWPGLPDGLD